MSLRVSPKHGLNPSLGLCFFCNKAKDVLLLGRLPDDAEAPRQGVYNQEPCDECRGYMDKGIICISCDPVKSKTQVRDHECLACHHKWASPVRYGTTPNMSGELTEQCRVCNRRTSISSGPQHDGVDTNNPYRTGSWIVLREEALRRFGLPPEMLTHILEKRVYFLEDEVWDTLGLPRVEREKESDDETSTPV